MFDYPNKLDIIFDKLYLFGIKSIIVGGYIRDNILHLDSKDIDIELYGLDSLELLEDLLKEFGEINTVGKFFGVCKLRYDDLELDFSLPREDTKTSAGHKGFSVTTKKDLDFKSAASRRDFTINAMGYDIQEKKILDPFHGQKDIKHKVLRAVDINKFAQDPLRVLRAVQFSSRFNFSLDESVLSLCKKLIADAILLELPKERIYEELKKMFLQSPIPSSGLYLLRDLKLLDYFSFNESYGQIDYFAKHNLPNNDINILIIFSLLYTKKNLIALNKLTNKQELLTNVALFLNEKEKFNIDDISNYTIYKLAINLNIDNFLLYMDAYYCGQNNYKITTLRQKAKSLHVLHNKLPALLYGKELIHLGLAPSKEFSKILAVGYEAQMKEEFRTLQTARVWLKSYLCTTHLL